MKKLTSWIDIPKDSDFSIYNLPYGVFSELSKEHKPTPNDARMGIRIGNYVLDMREIARLGLFSTIEQRFFNESKLYHIFSQSTLNEYIGLGKSLHQAVRNRLLEILDIDNEELKKFAHSVLLPIENVQTHLPVEIGDYTDFYSSEEHATNVGKMFRDPANALLPNWKHLPVGYHGRASSIVVSGTSLHRPWGQVKPADHDFPVFKPSQMLDFELEVAFIIGKNTSLGEAIKTSVAEDYIFGLVLFNDWSARDIQSWEYMPLGPFLGKNFGSSMSAWVVTLEALDYFRTASPLQNPPVLPYLQFEGKKNYDLNLQVAIQTQSGEEKVVCKSNFKYLYWNMCQQLAHHTVNGCNVNIGDVCASGTISGKEPDSFGSMLELTWRGTKPIAMPDGTERKFINDYDTVIMMGFAEKDGIRVGFGEVSGQILPAKTLS
jgi:fumarylacetoacetase